MHKVSMERHPYSTHIDKGKHLQKRKNVLESIKKYHQNKIQMKLDKMKKKTLTKKKSKYHKSNLIQYKVTLVVINSTYKKNKNQHL